MSLKKIAVAGMLGAATMAMSVSAFAQRAAETGWYVGASLGQADLGADKDTSWKISAGYQINRNFAAELGYIDFGEVSAAGITAASTGWELIGVGKYPFANQFSAYGLLGLVRGETKLSGAASGSDSSTELTFGLGAQYDFSRQLGVRAQWQRVNTDQEIDVLSIGVVWKF
jgi:OmpA-OmpF porin, OOP family